MQHRYYLALFLALMMGSSCATLSVTDIKNLDRTAFEPLDLRPDFETNDLRIDVIRSTESDTTSSHDLPYHPLGFDLGNGLFYDLNENLSFRIDALLGLTHDTCYTLNRFDRKRKKHPDCTFRFCQDTLSTISWPFRRKVYLYHRAQDGRQINIMHRKRFQYAIRFTDNTVEYGGKKKAWETIRMVNDNLYYLNRGDRESYELKEGKIYLEDDYIIELSNQNRTLSIIRHGLLWDRCLYTIEKDRDKLYIYDRQFNGKRIDRIPDGIVVYQDKSFQKRWTRQ